MKELQGRGLSCLIIVDRSLLEIEEIRKHPPRILELFVLRENGELFCNLIMAEREDDIPQVIEDDLNWRSVHKVLIRFAFEQRSYPSEKYSAIA